MYLEAVKVFCDVVRYRSFSRAGSANGISQSAVSQNVLQLEKSLGVRLIDRSKRPLELTPEGQVYHEGCQGLVEQYRAVEARVKALADEVVGTVRVAAIYSVGLGTMSQYVRRFAQRHPQANIRLAYLHPEQVYQSVLNEEADLGLLSYPQMRRKVAVWAWREERMVLVCWPGHALANGSGVGAADLAGERFVAFDEGLTIRDAIDRELSRGCVAVDVVMSFDSIEAIKRAVEIGEGVSILPEPTVRSEVAAGTLAAVPLVDMELVRPLGFIYRRNIELSPAARAFIGLVTGQSKERPGRDPAAEAAVRDDEESDVARDAEATSGVGMGVGVGVGE